MGEGADINAEDEFSSAYRMASRLQIDPGTGKDEDHRQS